MITVSSCCADNGVQTHNDIELQTKAQSITNVRLLSWLCRKWVWSRNCSGSESARLMLFVPLQRSGEDSRMLEGLLRRR